MKKITILLLLVTLSAGMSGQTPGESEESFMKYLENNKDSLNMIEGIWEVSNIQEFYHYDTLYDVIKNYAPSRAVIKREGTKFHSFSLNGNPPAVEFIQTDVNGVYLIRNYYPETKQYSKAQAVICKSGNMEYTIDISENYLKENPRDEDIPGIRIVNILTWTRVF